MELKVVFVFLFLAFLIIPGGHCARFQIKNNCDYTIWPATDTNPNIPRFPTGGFELASKQTSQPYDSPANWEGRIWARTDCANNNGQFSCVTGNCAGGLECTAGGATPTSLVEIALQGNPPAKDLDFYDISLVDGFNLPVGVAPQGQGASCQSLSCGTNVNAQCPEGLIMKGPNGATVGCKSSCVAFPTTQNCCTKEYDNSGCPPSDSAKIFKAACPQAYSYAKDDLATTSCRTGADYLITFCP